MVFTPFPAVEGMGKSYRADAVLPIPSDVFAQLRSHEGAGSLTLAPGYPVLMASVRDTLHGAVPEYVRGEGWTLSLSTNGPGSFLRRERSGGGGIDSVVTVGRLGINEEKRQLEIGEGRVFGYVHFEVPIHNRRGHPSAVAAALATLATGTPVTYDAHARGLAVDPRVRAYNVGGRPLMRYAIAVGDPSSAKMDAALEHAALVLSYIKEHKEPVVTAIAELEAARSEAERGTLDGIDARLAAAVRYAQVPHPGSLKAQKKALIELAESFPKGVLLQKRSS